MEEFLAGILIFQVVTDILDVCVGSTLVFGALKWNKGLITYISIAWGALIGMMIGAFLAESTGSGTSFVICTLLSMIIFPVLTYTVAGVNRFVIGFIVMMKLSFMMTTYLFKNGSVGIDMMFLAPILIGAIAGIVFMLWKACSILPFVLACTFLGASYVAPTISKYINQFVMGVTQDYSSLIDPVDLIFALFKIELTDGWTLFLMIVLMGIGVPVQINSIKKQGFTLDTPIITYETEIKEQHGKIVAH